MPEASRKRAKKPKKQSNNNTSSDIRISNTWKPIEQPKEVLSKVMEQLSVTTDNSRKIPPSLSDMPIDVVGLIIEKSDYMEQLKLRKVSKSLRALVDKQRPACESIRVVFWDKSITITFSNHSVVYANHEHDHEQDGIWIVRDDFEKVAFDDLASTLKNPKLQLEELSFYFCYSEKEDIEKYCNEMRGRLKSLNHKLSVKKFASDLPFPSNLLSLLPCLKPKLLEEISLILIGTEIDPTEMNQVARLEQWKQAEELELQDCFDRFPLEYATHFKRVHISEEKMETDKFTRIKNYLSKLHNFEQCTLSWWWVQSHNDFVSQVLGAPVSSNGTEKVFHYSIPDSDYFLEFTKPIYRYVVKIEKKKRENN